MAGWGLMPYFGYLRPISHSMADRPWSCFPYSQSESSRKHVPVEMEILIGISGAAGRQTTSSHRIDVGQTDGS